MEVLVFLAIVALMATLVAVSAQKQRIPVRVPARVVQPRSLRRR